MPLRTRGFTLIEMMVVVAIAAIMLGIGVPSFKSFIAGQRVKTAATDFAMAAINARSEAIKRNVPVSLTAAAGGWANGWATTGGGLSLASQSPYKGLQMTLSNATTITYAGSGRLDPSTVPDPTKPPTFQVNDPDKTAVRCISFDLSGLPKSRKGAC